MVRLKKKNRTTKNNNKIKKTAYIKLHTAHAKKKDMGNFFSNKNNKRI